MIDPLGLLLALVAAAPLPSDRAPSAVSRLPASLEQQTEEKTPVDLEAWIQSYRARANPFVGRERVEQSSPRVAKRVGGSRPETLSGPRLVMPQTSSAPQPEATTTSLSVGVNSRELAAQIAGYNLTLRALEADMDEERSPMADQLTGSVDQLVRLAARHEDCHLVAGLLSAEDRRFVGELEPFGPAQRRLARRVDAATDHAMGPDFVGTARDRMIELRELSRLERTLNEMDAVE